MTFAVYRVINDEVLLEEYREPRSNLLKMCSSIVCDRAHFIGIKYFHASFIFSYNGGRCQLFCWNTLYIVTFMESSLNLMITILRAYMSLDWPFQCYSIFLFKFCHHVRKKLKSSKPTDIERSGLRGLTNNVVIFRLLLNKHTRGLLHVNRAETMLFKNIL